MAAESAPAVKSKKRKKEKAEKAETAAEPQAAKAQPAGSGSKRRKKVKALVAPEEEARRQKQLKPNLLLLMQSWQMQLPVHLATALDLLASCLLQFHILSKLLLI